MKRAVYAGSFDPPTNGHQWMIREAVNLFDELILAVGINPEKHSTFNAEDRAQMLRDITGDLKNLRLEQFGNQFLVDYAKEIGANYIVRAIRSATDYEYERTMRHINADLHPEITTVFLLPPREFAEVSSTMVRGLIGPKGWEDIIHRYLPEAIYHKMVAYHKQGLV